MSFSLFDFNLYGLIFCFLKLKKIWVKMTLPPHAKKLVRHAVFVHYPYSK